MRLPPRTLFRLFPLAARTSQWLEHRYSRSGRLLLGLFVAATLFGVDLNQTLAYQLAALAFALLAASHLASARWRPRISVRRILPDCVTDGVPTCYWLEFRNDGLRLERDLLLHDRLGQPIIAYDTFHTALRQSGGASNWFDRAIGFPRWVELRRSARGAELPLAAIPTLPPGGSARVRVDTTFVRRGWIRFEAIELRRPDPLGLVYARYPIELPAALLALPLRHSLPRVQVVTQRRYQRGGVSLALAVGDSQEFASLREYRPGDPRRHIHWRSFAKTGQLIVKEYQDEYFDRHALVVDTYAGSGEATLFESVIRVAASVAASERPRDSILDVLFTGTDLLELSAGRGLGDARRALTYLAEARPSTTIDFLPVGARLLTRAAQCASVVMVLGRWDATRHQVARDLRTRGTRILCLCVVPDDSTATGAVPEDGLFRLRITHLATDLQRIGQHMSQRIDLPP